ncbi:MAG: matrixin family metalloprotease [Chloroflexi bacterium]|nr:matrixin family metalloprotease [Chloroflexota bacterium]
MLLGVWTVLLSPTSVRADGPADGAIPYDDGVQFAPAPIDSFGDRVAALAVRFFTDCAPGDIGSCGGPPGRWQRTASPVPFCTFQANRPSGVAADQFRDAVAAGADMWNAVEVAVGVNYVGDCSNGVRWENDNGRNELGWDDSRFVISGSTAGVARGTWQNLPGFGAITDRRFTEFDVVFKRDLNVPDRCLRSIVAHEIGHTLGLGHSDSPNDLMYPTFNPNDPASCRADASATERSRLAELYGVNRAPTVQLNGPASAFVGSPLTLTASATDPEGDPVSFTWTQVAGPTVTLATAGATATFVAPDSVGSTMRFRVTTRDYFLHQASAEIAIAIDIANAPPRIAPALASFLPGSSGSVLGWESVSGAANYRFCADTSCSTAAEPQATVTWEVVLGSAGAPDARRVLTTGARRTSLAACNSIGCSSPGDGPLAGGVVWPAWGIDFGYIGWAYDVPAAGIRFTIGGVVNQSGAARKFTIYSGTATDPRARVVQNCGRVSAGGLCIGLLTPQQAGHSTTLTVVSELAGTPTVEQQVKIR